MDAEYMDAGTYNRMAVLEYAREHGRQDPERAWISTPFDTWERNPAYTGPPVPHPEEEWYEED